jgi:phosphatidate cytidylyltransferase
VILTLLISLTAMDFRGTAGASPGMWLMPWLLLITVLATEEVLSLFAAKGLKPVAWPVYVGTVGITLAFAHPMASPWFPAIKTLFDGDALAWPLMSLTCAIGLILAVEMRRFDGPGQHVLHIALATFAVVYIGLLGGFMVALRLHDGNVTGMTALISMLFVVKMSDVGAYAFGRTLGANKFTPKLSPGKTVEGAIGGIATACVASWLFFRLIAPQWMPSLASQGPSYLATIVYGLILAIAGIVGDLAESLLKRDMERKDSSSWLPGLGGVLDVIDSLLLAGPAAYLCWELGLLK